MMQSHVSELSGAVLYQHLLRLIVPRPIAWVSTASAEGQSNLAPFSFFSGVGVNPPTLLFCPANRADGLEKDTLRNIRQTRQFVVNMVTEELAAIMNSTSAELPENESEFDVFGIETAESVVVRVPCVAAAVAHLECELQEVISLAEGPGAANIVIGRILYLRVDDRIVNQSGFADPELYQAVGRLGGASYCRTRDTFDLPRPRTR